MKFTVEMLHVGRARQVGMFSLEMSSMPGLAVRHMQLLPYGHYA